MEQEAQKAAELARIRAIQEIPPKDGSRTLTKLPTELRTMVLLNVLEEWEETHCISQIFTGGTFRGIPDLSSVEETWYPTPS